MVNGYADIYKDNTRKHLRTQQCQIEEMVNGYADIYKDNTRKHLRTQQCQIEEVSSPRG